MLLKAGKYWNKVLMELIKGILNAEISFVN